MKENLHLFTSVKDELPEEDKKYPVIVVGEACGTPYQIFTMGIYRGSKGWEMHFSGEWINENDCVNEMVVYYLDLSKLTSKKKAEDLAWKSYFAGGDQNALTAYPITTETFNTFMNENKNML